MARQLQTCVWAVMTMLLLNVLLVGVGGALGALARGGLSSLTQRVVASAWPWVTFSINVIACFIMGMSMQMNLDQPLYLMLTTGFLGGFSTLSTMNYEAITMVSEKRRKWLGAWYVAATYMVCLASAAVGFLLGGLF